MKYVNFIIGSFILSLFIFSGSYSFLGCAQGPFEVATPTPTVGPTPSVTQRVLQINFIMSGQIDKNNGYYIFAFNRPNPVKTTIADPISTNSSFWTDYVSFGSSTKQAADFVRRERLNIGDTSSDWNPTVFTFTTGSYGDKYVQIILPITTLGTPKDLYFNFITTDANGTPRDALGFGLGSTTDSVRLQDLMYNTALNTPLSITDMSGDEITSGIPSGVNPLIFDIISGAIILKDQ